MPAINNKIKKNTWNKWKDIKLPYEGNPFPDIQNEKDIRDFVWEIINSTQPEGKFTDMFWDQCEAALMCAVIAYTKYREPEADQSMLSVIRTIQLAQNDDKNTETGLDSVFEGLRVQMPKDWAVTQYDAFQIGSWKYQQPIVRSCLARMKEFTGIKEGISGSGNLG